MKYHLEGTDLSRLGARSRLLAALTLGVSIAFGVVGQAGAQVPAGRLVQATVHGKALENNVTGESPDRHVSIYLPPDYDANPTRRYPVVYLLHGIGDTDTTWTKGPGEWNSIQSVMDNGIASGDFGDMIVVMPDERTKWFGSFYTNSSATGRWADFTVKELVAYVDSHYRTLRTAGGRGIAGHSMGGYGALKLGMTHPDVYSAVYGMSPALIGWSGELTPEDPAFEEDAEAKSYSDLLKGGTYPVGIVTVAQAFSPDRSKPPFYCDLPFKAVGGKMLPAEPAFDEWSKNFLVNMVEANRGNLLRLRGIQFDAGDSDEFKFIPIESWDLSRKLTANGVSHVFEEFNGDHRNRLWGADGRVRTTVMPFFWRLLDHGTDTAKH